MDPVTILTLILRGVPEAVTAYEKIRGTLSETDLTALDAQMAAGDAQVAGDHDALAALIQTL